MKHRAHNIKHERKGVALVLTILVLVGILAVSLGVASLMIGEIKITREIPLALKAYYAAEAGVEKSLYNARRGGGASDIGSPPSCTGGGAECLNSDTCYSVKVVTGGTGDCAAASYCIKSYGCHKRIKRSVEVSY